MGSINLDAQCAIIYGGDPDELGLGAIGYRISPPYLA